MDYKRKKELRAEIEKEEKLCKDIYEEILKNRVAFEKEILALKLQSSRIQEANSAKLNFSRGTSNNKENGTKEVAVSPIKVIFNSNSFSSRSSKNSANSPFKNHVQRLGKKQEMRIPLGALPLNRMFEDTSSRKNPLDSLRNTTDRNDILASIDSLQYSEDLSFL